MFISTAHAADPRTNCWFTTYSRQYARIYTNNAMLSSGSALTSWSNGSQTQSLPAYDGVQEVYSSTDWIYARSTGLAGYNMGPWQNGAFPNLPVNQKMLFRFPRTNGVPATKTLSGGGQIGIFVDGVAMFNSWDAYTWSTVSNVDAQNITGYWNRDAYVNEGATFDPGYAHQQNTGVYHYHADPIGLRYLLGDHVDYNAATKTYGESTNPPTQHSPILAWTADGFPVYGPYGYFNTTNANSGLRRMVSGYVLRNGQNGTDNLPLTGRTTIPQWAVRLYNVSANQPGAPFTGVHTNGCYMEDNDYLGDLTNSATGTNYQQGVDFDLDEYNGRWCVTPEFPTGIYAYFVAISSNGVPVFPYNIGRGFYGSPVGGAVSVITETVATNFLGNTNLVSTLNAPGVNNGTVTLVWSAIEGGSYQVQATTNLSESSAWTVLATGVSPNQTAGSYTDNTSLPSRFYRVGLASVANYDTAGTTLFGINVVAPGGSASRGQTVSMTITLPSSPPNPPVNAPLPNVMLTNTVSLWAISGSDISRPATNSVVAVFAIPANAPTNVQNVVVTFAPPPGQIQGATCTLTNGFTIN